MFGKKCYKCGKKISNGYDFCPYCGMDLIGERNSETDDYGFLGKNDFKGFDDMDLKLPFGFNTLMKPLMKELVKQMGALDKELTNEKKPVNLNNKNGPFRTTSFSIHIGMPGQKPVKLISSDNGRMQIESSRRVKQEVLRLPKIADDDLVKLKNLAKKEPKTEVRRLADRIIYEIFLPEVNSLKNINISQLESAIEIKAFSDKELFVKKIEMDLQLINYSFSNERLVLELMAK